jgi:glyoxylase-like metal-dependent hydrolase (beta-lactamase superfamily II)
VLIAGFPAGPWGTNCYVVATGPGSECVVIDPGKDAAAAANCVAVAGEAT